MNKKYNCIIDCDPGVDDTVAVVLSFDDIEMDIKLITTVAGNRGVDVVTNNILHILDLYKQDIPVAKGAKKALCRNSKDARDVHKFFGLGGYIPRHPLRRCIKESAVDAMYRVIMESEEPVYILDFGPHTNIASLILAHPEVKPKIKRIIGEGCCPYGIDGRTHISFNVSTDPEAFKIVLDSGIPLTMIPSHMGRELVNLTEEECRYIKTLNRTGKFFYKMFTRYWEKGYPDKRISINDSCICLYLRWPELFSVKKTNIVVDLNEVPGKTIMDFNPKGKCDYVYACDREQIHKHMITAIKKLDKYKLLLALGRC